MARLLHNLAEFDLTKGKVVGVLPADGKTNH